MTEIVTAVYEKGLLRPLQPLKLRERQTVRIQVLLDEPIVRDALNDGTRNEVEDEVEEIISSLVAAGLMRPRPEKDAIPPDPLSAEERRALADRLGSASGKSASEMVIEDRGEW
jgi:predicted DNA-binding antitoxin AbrB/MazE fold protein